jgi:hypothetical protein
MMNITVMKKKKRSKGETRKKMRNLKMRRRGRRR